MTYFQEIQKFLTNYYELSSDQIDQILCRLPPSRIMQYIGHKLEILNLALNPTRSENSKQELLTNNCWQNSYNQIKADSWPECKSVTDFYLLPNEIQQECIHVHKFSPDIWFNKNLTYDSWQESIDWSYEITSLIRINCVILENLEFIKNKRILDFATHHGFISNICLFNQAQHVTFTEIRKPVLDLAVEQMQLMQYPESQYRAELANIHDYPNNTKLCQDKDTVILSGIIYHVHDHYAILESIANARPKHIIIETVHNKDIVSESAPLIYWITEDAEKNLANGWHDNLSTVVIGLPNLSWFTFTMKFFGYQLTKERLYDYWVPSDDVTTITKPTETRSVQVFTNETH